MTGHRFVAVVGLLVMASFPLTSVADIPLAPPSTKGQTVTPVFEGWYRNPDGTYSLSFGYFNRNFEEVLELPNGPPINRDRQTGRREMCDGRPVGPPSSKCRFALRNK